MRDMIFISSDMLLSKLEKAKYSAKIGLIMYAMVKIRIDSAFAISMISKFANNPSLKHFHAINEILCYLAGSQDRGITFGKEEKLKLIGYSDLDWARDCANQKSTSRFIFILNGGPVSYAFKKQAVIAFSSTKAKYMALNLVAQKGIWLRLLLIELGLLTLSNQFAKIYPHEHNKYAKAILLSKSILYLALILDQI